MNSMHKNKRYGFPIGSSNSMKPRGVHHTVSYAVSFNDTWAHIKNELKKPYQPEQMQLHQA